MRTFPAIDVAWPAPPSGIDVDLLLAAIDDFEPTAVEEQPLGVRVFFPDEPRRDEAASTAGLHFPDATVTAVLVPDDDWAERSQAGLRPALIDDVVVSPPWALAEASAMATASGRPPVIIAIQPSMGFGTGHHASTRLCLRLLQRTPLAGVTVLDIGTGSGVLAIAACSLGAARAVGIDVDRDALDAAAGNVVRNGSGDAVSLAVADLARLPDHLPLPCGLVLANITGAMLQRHAAALAGALVPGGRLIASGFQTHEQADLARAFRARGLTTVDEVEDESWVAVAFDRTARDVNSSPTGPTTG